MLGFNLPSSNGQSWRMKPQSDTCGPYVVSRYIDAELTRLSCIEDCHCTTNTRVQGKVYVDDSCDQNNQGSMMGIVHGDFRSSFETEDTESRATCISYEKVSSSIGW